VPATIWFVFFGLMQIEGSFGEPVFDKSTLVYCANELLNIKNNNAEMIIFLFMIMYIYYKINQ